MTQPQTRFSDHTPQNHTNEPTTRRPYLRGAFVAIPVVFYVLCKLSNQQTALYELLVRWSDRCGLITTPQATIAHQLGCKPTSLARHLALLVEKDLIRFEPGGHIELRQLRSTSLRELGGRDDLELLANENQQCNEEAVALISDAIVDDGRLEGSDRRVFGLYAARASSTDGTTFVSDARMARDLKLSVRTVRRSKKHLEQLGYIKVHRGKAGRQTITLLPPELAPIKDEEPTEVVHTTTPDCPPTPLQIVHHNQIQRDQTEEHTQNARAHGARNQSGSGSQQERLLDEDTRELLALTEKVFEDTPDPNADQLPQLIRRRLQRGQTLALLTTALLAYRDYARYQLPASTIMRSGLDRWAIPKARRTTSLSKRQRHAIESERRFKANLYVGAHEPRLEPTPQEQEVRRRRLEAWWALPLNLPTCERTEEQQHQYADQLFPTVRRAEPVAFLDFFAGAVWGRHISVETALEAATAWLVHRTGRLELHQLEEAFEQALRRGRRDVPFEEFTPSSGSLSQAHSHQQVLGRS